MDLRSINKKLIKLHSDDVSNMKYMQLISFRDEKARVMYEHKEREFINLTNAQSLLCINKGSIKLPQTVDRIFCNVSNKI
jgi:hypothetical protein